MQRQVHLYIRFQLGNSFGNTDMKGKSTYIRFQFAHSFGTTKMKGKSTYIFVSN